MLGFIVLLLFGAYTVFRTKKGHKSASYPIIIEYAQQVALIATVRFARLPSSLSQFYNTVSLVNVSSSSAAPECVTVWNYSQSLRFSMMLPFVIVLILLVVYLIHNIIYSSGCFTCIPSKFQPANPRNLREIYAYFGAFNMGMLMVYIPATRSSIEALICIDPGDGSSVVAGNPAISCDTEEHQTNQGIAGVVLVLWGLGIPLYILLSLKQISDFSNENTVFKIRCIFLPICKQGR